jgi:hypothetical protein
MIVLVEKQTREKHAKKGTYMAQEEKKLVVDWEELANHLLDMAIESWSPNEVMESLYASGFSEELLTYLGFDSDAVEEMVKENAKTKLDDSQDAPYQAHKDAKGE